MRAWCALLLVMLMAAGCAEPEADATGPGEPVTPIDPGTSDGPPEPGPDDDDGTEPEGHGSGGSGGGSREAESGSSGQPDRVPPAEPFPVPPGTPLRPGTYHVALEERPVATMVYTVQEQPVRDAWGRWQDGYTVAFGIERDGWSQQGYTIGFGPCTTPLWFATPSQVSLYPYSALYSLPPFLWAPRWDALPEVDPFPDSGLPSATGYATVPLGGLKVAAGAGDGTQLILLATYGEQEHPMSWWRMDTPSHEVPQRYEHRGHTYVVTHMQTHGGPIGRCPAYAVPEGPEIPLGTSSGPATDPPLDWPLSEAVARARAQPDLFTLQRFQEKYPETYLLEASYRPYVGGDPTDPTMEWTLHFAAPAVQESVLVVCGVNDVTRQVPYPACSEEPHQLWKAAPVMDWDTVRIADPVASHALFEDVYGFRPCTFSFTLRPSFSVPGTGSYTWECPDPETAIHGRLTAETATGAVLYALAPASWAGNGK